MRCRKEMSERAGEKEIVRSRGVVLVGMVGAQEAKEWRCFQAIGAYGGADTKLEHGRATWTEA